jgi:hypothetical protein
MIQRLLSSTENESTLSYSFRDQHELDDSRCETGAVLAGWTDSRKSWEAKASRYALIRGTSQERIS